MALKCPVCRSADTQVGMADNNQCLNCGALFDSQGNAVDVGMDASTRAAAEARLAPRSQHLSGNLADLQRLGAEKAPDPKAEAFVVPPGVDLDRVPKHGERSPAEIAAAVPPQGDSEPPTEQVDTAKAAEIAAGKAAAKDQAAADREAAKAAKAAE